MMKQSKKTVIKKKRGEGNRNAAGNPGGGRSTLYRPEYDEQVKRLALLGLSDEEMAEFFEISASALYAWRKEFPSFNEALRAGKIEADGKVARALYKRALGYRYNETTLEAGKLTKVVTKHIPGDVGAQTLWLKNRQRDKWRATDINLSDLTDDQLDRLLNLLQNGAQP